MKDYTSTHIVFKNADIDKYLNKKEKRELDIMKAKIAVGRMDDNKPSDNTYLIVNSDELYYKEVLDLVQKHEFYKHY